MLSKKGDTSYSKGVATRHGALKERGHILQQGDGYWTRCSQRKGTHLTARGWLLDTVLSKKGDTSYSKGVATGHGALNKRGHILQQGDGYWTRCSQRKGTHLTARGWLLDTVLSKKGDTSYSKGMATGHGALKERGHILQQGGGY